MNKNKGKMSMAMFDEYFHKYFTKEDWAEAHTYHIIHTKFLLTVTNHSKTRDKLNKFLKWAEKERSEGFI